MTLIVGLICRDGIVMGADAAATFITPEGISTVRQPMKKLLILRQRGILGVSGSVGLAQLLEDKLGNLVKERTLTENSTLEEARRAVRDAVADELTTAQQRARVAVPSAAPMTAGNATTHSLVALPAGRNGYLVQVDPVGQTEVATEDLPYVSVGSGQPIADTLLGFLRKVLWPKGLPALSDGVLTVTWALDEAIRLAPGGIAKPVQVATLLKKKGQFIAEELKKTQLYEHRQNISDMGKRWQDYKASQQVIDGEDVPPPPSLPTDPVSS